MRILLTGGTGFIGRPLKHELLLSDHELTVLTRLSREGSEKLEYIRWNPLEEMDLSPLVNKADVVVNLAGESIIEKKWTKEQKEILLKSRTNPTRILVEAINNATKKPKKFISASAIGIYGDRSNEELTENSSLGNDFLAEICKAWESIAMKAQTNVTILRIGIVLDKSGGALKKMLPPFKFFLGGPLGSGEQWMPWISLKDVLGVIKFIIENDNVSGILNLTSPKPVTNKEFSSTLGKVLFRPSLLPAPTFALKLLLGERSSLLLSSQKAIPQKLIQYGYEFKDPELEEALLGLRL